MIDDELLVATRSKPIKKNELLADLLESRLIDVYRYRDDGPPTDLTPTTESPLRGASPAHRGWVAVTDADPEHEIWAASWRWFTACVQHDGPSKDHELSKLGQSLLQRVERALEARDHLLVALNQPQHNDTRREVLRSLDDILVDLMGALDAAARVAHRVLALAPRDEYRAGWQKGHWLAQVTQAAPNLAQITTHGTPASDALTILRLLRNSVHGKALQAMAAKDVGVRDEHTTVGIPPNETDVLDAMDRLGGQTAWGARQLLPDQVHIDAGVFIDTLIPRIVDLLNELMERTPVERLSNVALAPSDYQPPAPDPQNTGIWDESVRTSIRWQLGL